MFGFGSGGSAEFGLESMNRSKQFYFTYDEKRGPFGLDDTCMCGHKLADHWRGAGQVFECGKCTCKQFKDMDAKAMNNR